jgi:hypothetical protein
MHDALLVDQEQRGDRVTVVRPPGSCFEIHAARAETGELRFVGAMCNVVGRDGLQIGIREHGEREPMLRARGPRGFDAI